MQIAVIIFAVSGTLAIIALFVRDRAREGIRPLEITNKDKADLKDLKEWGRREFAPRRFFGGLLGQFGGICILAGFLSPFYADTVPMDWWASAYCIVVGLVLVFFATRLVKHSR